MQRLPAVDGAYVQPTARRIRVLHVTTSAVMGGAERLLIDLIRYQRGVQNVVCTILPEGPLHDELRSLGVESHALGVASVRGAPRALTRLTALMRAGSFDVVHTHLLHASLIGQLSAQLARVPAAVMTRHNASYFRMYGSVMERAWDRVCNRLAHRIFAVSEAARAELLAEGVAPERIQVIPNGIDAEHVRRLATDRPGTKRDSVLLGNVASLHARKGHRDLLIALGIAVDQGLNAQLVIAGEGPLRGSLDDIVRSQNLTGRVKFVGHVANPYAAMADIDIYVQPSLEEGFGIAVLEAMALEKPVVASRVGGLSEIVVDGQTGVLVPPGQPDQLAVAINRLARDPELRHKFGLRARERVDTMFKVSDTAAAYLDAYQSLLHAREVRR